MKPWLPILVLMLAGCNSPSLYFRGVPAARIAVDGSVFDVRIRGTLAEAIRINPQYAPRFGPIRARAGLAMGLISGCPVTRVLGDQAQATGKLACPKPPQRPAREICRRLGMVTGRDGWRYPAYDCGLGRSSQVIQGGKPSIYWG